MFQDGILRGERVIITGGGSGLGRAIAERCMGLGAEVAIIGRELQKLETAAAELRQAGNAKIIAHACDVRDYEQVGAAFSEIENKIGPPTLLVNNAAGNFLCPSEDLTPNGFKSIVDIVLTGTFNCTQHFGRRRITAGGGGAVLSIATTYAESGSAFVLPSACAKAGVVALTKSLAFEWGEYKIRLNAIAPGPFPTPGAWKRLVPNAQFEDAVKKRIPLGRFTSASELADAAVFLLSPQSGFITGECLAIDGGEQLNGGEFNWVTQLMPRGDLKKLFAGMRGG